MNCEALFESLRVDPPAGWRIIHYGQGHGVCIWPHNLREFRGQDNNPLLRGWELLFECHRIEKSGKLRLIARAKVAGPNFRKFRSAADAAECKPPQSGAHEVTRGVAIWPVATIPTEAGANAGEHLAENAALTIRQFLANPDKQLVNFLGRLALLG